MRLGHGKLGWGESRGGCWRVSPRPTPNDRQRLPKRPVGPDSQSSPRSRAARWAWSSRNEGAAPASARGEAGPYRSMRWRDGSKARNVRATRLGSADLSVP